jgi:hypothetical protein
MQECLNVKGSFLICSAAMVARAAASCTAFVGARERAVYDYSVKFP